MNYNYENLRKDNKFEKRIKITCNMNNAKYEFIQGKIIGIDKTNISIIEPHRFNISIKSKGFYDKIVLIGGI